MRSDVLIGRRYLAIRSAKPKAKIRSGQKNLLKRIQRGNTTFSHEANQQPKLAVAIC